MIVVPSPSPSASPIQKVACSGTFFTGPRKVTKGSEIKELQGIHSIAANGKLSQLLEFYKNFKEPQQLSSNFIYSWISTNSPSPSEKYTPEQFFQVSQTALKWLDGSVENEEKEKLIFNLPSCLWPLIIAHIPLSNMKSLHQLSVIFSKQSNGLINYKEVLDWKLNEDAVLLYEFKSNRGIIDVERESYLPQFVALIPSFPEISFVSRTLTMSSKFGVRTKFVKETYDISSYGKKETSQVVQHYQVGDNGVVYKRHSLGLDLALKEPDTNDVNLLVKNHLLFREPNKMCFVKGNTSPAGFDWFPLFNESSVEHFTASNEESFEFKAPESAA
eukprot:TRINITY_DN12800_c0_g1_i1.p1 TRINITY_DN12800_c0_g1~~TRINITY_DN12800_c0_g1_i1.p1  ORF type:complete len:331 (+),score=92.46 TRINITY_DN12800_c0_g1_i1:195-1187(+)